MSRIPANFVWSPRREKIFRECPRKFYFHCVALSPNPEAARDDRSREIAALARLWHRAEWADAQVRGAIRRLIQHARAGSPWPPSDQAQADLLDRMRSDFRESKNRAYRKPGSRQTGLFEHEYEVQIPDTEWKNLADRASACMRRFMTSGWPARLRDVPADQWIETTVFRGVMNGLPVNVPPDCAFRENGKPVVVMWRTGFLPPDDGLIMISLALAIREVAGLHDSQIVEHELDADGSVSRLCEFAEDRIGEMREAVMDSADEMLYLMTDSEDGGLHEKSFVFAEDESACRRCAFLKVCPRWE